MMMYEKPQAEIISFETEGIMLSLNELENELHVDMSQGPDEW